MEPVDEQPNVDERKIFHRHHARDDALNANQLNLFY